MIFRKSLLILVFVFLSAASFGSASLKKQYFAEMQQSKHMANQFAETATTNITTNATTTPQEESNTTSANASEKTNSTNITKEKVELCTKQFLNNLTLITITTNHKSVCAFAKDKCPGDVVNWFGILFCQLNGQIWVFILISIVAIYAIFVFTSATVDEFIAEGITALADFLKLSDAMAAVTLIALANGAGDVITALVASGSDGGVSYNIGSLYGAGFFVAACVIALTIRIYCNETKEDFIQLDASLFFRDILIYVIATLVTIIFAFTNFIRWWQAVIYLVIYVVLVFIVAIQDRYQRVEDQKLLEEQDKKKAESQAIRENKSKGFSNKAALSKIQKVGKTLQSVAKIKKAVSLRKFREIELKKKREEREKSFGEHDAIGRLTVVIDFIPKAIRSITMMPASVEEYDKYLVAFWPLGGFIFFFWAFKLSFKSYLFAGLPISILLTFFLWWQVVRGTEHKVESEEDQKELKKSVKKVDQEAMPYLPSQKLSEEIEKEKKEEEKEMEKLPRHFLAVQVISAITGLVWCFITISILMDLLNCFIVIFGLNNTFMGLTILGIGNALPDALTTLALSRQGYALMGIIGGYSGQLFGLLVGFGIAQLKTTLQSGEQEFDIFKKPVSNLLDIIALFVTLATLVLTIVYGYLKKYRFDRTIGTILLITYILFFIVACIIQVYYIYSGEGSK